MRNATKDRNKSLTLNAMHLHPYFTLCMNYGYKWIVLDVSGLFLSFFGSSKYHLLYRNLFIMY